MEATIVKIDRYQRKITSIFYRLIIILYSIFISYFYNFDLPIYSYFLVYGLYISLYILLLGNSIVKSSLRLVNDYGLIFLTLIFVKSLNFLCISFIFLPILNSHNFSGNKKTILLYVLPITITYFSFGNDFNYSILIAFFSFYLINSLGTLREKYLLFQQELNGVIDDFFVNNSESRPSYLIYKDIIKTINKSNVFYNVESIICLHNKNGKTSVVNGSFFTWEVKIMDKEKYQKSLRNEDSYGSNIELYLNNELIKNNIVINCVMSDCHYSYIIVVKSNNSIVDNVKFLIFSKLILPILGRYSKVLKAEYNHKNNNINQLSVLQEKVNYVNNSVNSMHFIRNKLGPLKNYLAMVTDYETQEPELQRKIEPYIQKEREKLKSSIGSIIERAEYVLTKSNNPFNVYEVQEYGIQQLFSELMNIWNYHFNSDNIDLDWNISTEIKYNVKYNSTGLVLVISNWISNMKKYNSGEYGVILNENENYYFVNFYNSINQLENSFKFIDEYNNSGRDEISRRNSHGLLELKNFISQMSLEAEMKRNDSNVEFSIKFKKYTYNENSNY